MQPPDEEARMSRNLEQSLDALLQRVVSDRPGVPGVAAVATDRTGNIYEGAAGQRVLGEDAGFTPDTTCAAFSTTKAVAGTTCLQLVEEGSLDLDAPAKEYAPAIGELQVLDGFDAGGRPMLRAPKRDVTTRMLLLHTAGFGYDFFNEDYHRLATEHGQPSVITASHASLNTPLLFDPGERWEYGSNIDWAGQVVEGITGRRLGDVMRERVLEPLGMHGTAFTMTDQMRSRLARVHQRHEDGTLEPLRDLELPQDPEVHMGGHGLYSNALDYAEFIRMWLNDGSGPHGQVLRPETVRMAARNGLGDKKVKALPGVIPSLTHDAEFFPGMSKSWALTFMVNDEDAPTGRPAGALAWAGLANLYYWIDRANGVGGFWATQIFPFADPAAVGGYLDFETTVYRHLGHRGAA
jgi:methyl acetate hydrolase